MNTTLRRLEHSPKKSCLARISSSGSPISGICRATVRQIPRGFTLIELAVAIAVIALLLGSILVPLQTQVETRKYDETQRILDQAREALLGYAAAYGYFPCPASTTSNGQEAVDTVDKHITGACLASVAGTNAYIGFLPAAALGLTPTDSSGYALDAWGLPQNRIRYAVSNATINFITNAVTRINGMRTAGMSAVSSSTAMLYVCNSGTGVTGTNCGTAVALASSVPAVIWSLGPNAPTGGTSTHEAENLDNDRIFVTRTKAGAGAAGGEFDDVVTWIGASSLFSRLIAVGQLP